jgi:methyl-accepting chemotaxis protein
MLLKVEIQPMLVFFFHIFNIFQTFLTFAFLLSRCWIFSRGDYCQHFILVLYILLWFVSVYLNFVKSTEFMMIQFFKVIRNMITLFSSVIRPLSVTTDISKDPPSMNIIVNNSSRDMDMSNLSMISMVGALNVIGTDVRNSLDKIRNCLQQVNKSITQIANFNPQQSLMLAEISKQVQ